MAEILAARLAGDVSARFASSATATRLKVTGINVYSAGDFAGGDGCEEIVLRDDSAGFYRRLVLRNDQLVGAVLYGETADGPWFFDLLREQTATGPLRDKLIFGAAYRDVAALPAYCGRCSLSG